MDKHVDVNEVAAEAVDTEKEGKSGPTASEKKSGPTAGKKEQPQREGRTCCWYEKHSQQQARTDKEDRLRRRPQRASFRKGGSQDKARDVTCRRIISYTSYLRTNDCTNNGYVTDNLEHNTMINIDTVAHMIWHYTQS